MKGTIYKKQLWLEIIKKIGCSKSVKPRSCYTYTYIIFITQVHFNHLFSQFFRVRAVLSRCTFYKKMFLFFRHEKNVIHSKLLNNPSKARNAEKEHKLVFLLSRLLSIGLLHTLLVFISEPSLKYLSLCFYVLNTLWWFEI